MSTELSTTQGTPPARVQRAIKGERSSRRLDAHLKAAALSLATTVVVAAAVLGGVQTASAFTIYYENTSVVDEMPTVTAWQGVNDFASQSGIAYEGGTIPLSSGDARITFWLQWTGQGDAPSLSDASDLAVIIYCKRDDFGGIWVEGWTYPLVADDYTLLADGNPHRFENMDMTINDGQVDDCIADGNAADGFRYKIYDNHTTQDNTSLARYQSWGDLDLYPYAIWSVDPADLPPSEFESDTTTHIILHDPDNLEFISATTTALTLTVEGYINEDDFVEGMWVDLYTDNGCVASSQLVGPMFAFTQKSCPSGGALVSGLQSWTFYATTSGAFSFSTTSNAEVVGSYDMVSAIRKPWFTLLGLNIGKVTFDEYKTIFTVSTTTAFDVLRADTRTEMDAFFGTATSSEAVRGICNPISGSFSLGVCVSFLFAGGSTGEWATKVQAQMDDTIRRWPFGYVTLVVDALKNPNTDDADLPSITLDFSSLGIPATSASPDVELDPWSVFASSSLLSTAEDPKTHQTLRALIEPGLTGFIYLLFTLMVFLELIGFSMSTIQRGPGKNIN